MSMGVQHYLEGERALRLARRVVKSSIDQTRVPVFVSDAEARTAGVLLDIARAHFAAAQVAATMMTAGIQTPTAGEEWKTTLGTDDR